MTRVHPRDFRGLFGLSVCLGAMMAFPSEEGGVALAQPLTRSVYVTVTDKEGKPVTDLRADEFELKYAGKDQDITDVKLSTTPLRVAILVADRGSGIFQLGTLRFVEALLGRAEFSITGVVVQPERYVDYSAEVNALRPGLVKLQKRGNNQTGAQLVEAIQTAAREVRRQGYRPAIFVMRAGGEASTPIRAQTVREDLRMSGAVLYAISRTGTQGIGGGQNPTQAVTAASVAAAANAADAMEGQLTLGSILGEGSRDSGGRHIQTVAVSIVDLVQQIASELRHQYEITYTIPQAGRPNDRLEVSLKRKGLTLLAPTRVPN
jgi:VWFA-related protein